MVARMVARIVAETTRWMSKRSDHSTRTTESPGVESDGIGHVRRSFMRRWAVTAAERMARKETIPEWRLVKRFPILIVIVILIVIYCTGEDYD